MLFHPDTQQAFVELVTYFDKNADKKKCYISNITDLKLPVGDRRELEPITRKNLFKLKAGQMKEILSYLVSKGMVFEVMFSTEIADRSIFKTKQE